MKKQLCLLLFIVLFLSSIETAYGARNIVISSDKNSLSADDELNISASPSGFTNGEKIYIKGAFFKDGSSNYFGLTKFSDTWIKNSTTALSQKEVIIGSWDNTVVVKPDYSDSGFSGAGDYKFKLGFYYLTSGGNTSSINWSSNDLMVSLSNPIAPSPTQTQSKSTSSTSKSSSASKTPTPTKQPVSATSSKTAVVVATSKNTVKSVKISENSRPASEFAKIKPITDSENKKKVEVLGAKDERIDYSVILFIAGGLFLLLAGGLLGYRELKERESHKSSA